MSQYIRECLRNQPGERMRGTILIWNFTRTCNLRCKHCYASAIPEKDPGIPLPKIASLLPELKECGVRFVIVSGGEPLVRPDIFEIGRMLRDNGFVTSLSTNGLLIRESNLEYIRDAFSYVGISIDGSEEVHDRFRGKQGAFAGSLRALRMCRDAGIRTGVRFTLTKETYPSLPFVLELTERENFGKIYVSHLVYSGRAGRKLDLDREQYDGAMRLLLDKAFSYVESGRALDIVTGNNEADAVLLLEEFSRRYPWHADAMRSRLEGWGGNQAGARLMNIDADGFVRPDPFFQEPLGSVHERPLTEIWASDTSPVLARLREHPRRVAGRCSGCSHLSFCNGNSRARARAVHGDYFAEDPSCFI